MRLLMIAALATVVFVLFYTSGIETEPDSRTIQDFYHKTKNAMEGGSKGQTVLNSQTGNQAGHIPADKDGDGDIDEDDKQIAIKMQERLKAAEQKAKDKANEKAGLRPDPPSKMVGVGSSAEGQDKVEKAAGGDSAASSKDKKPVESKEKHEAEQELNSILKKSPGG